MVVLANARVFPYDQYVGADTGNIKIPGQAQSLRHADLFILDVENAGVLYIWVKKSPSFFSVCSVISFVVNPDTFICPI
jgi:hypothetical protein